MNQIKASLYRLRGLFSHPGRYFSDPEVTIWDGVIVICALFLVSFWQKLVWVNSLTTPINPWAALEKVAINSLLIWCLFCVLFFAISGFFQNRINLARLSGMVGSMGLPLVITTFLSALTWSAALLFGMDTSSALWLTFQNALSYIGLAFSWPGLFGFFLLLHGLNLKKGWAIALSGAAFLLFVVSPIIQLFV